MLYHRIICDRNKDRGLQRHSVEVTTGAGGYRHIRPNEINHVPANLALPVEGAITEESMTSSGNSDVAENHHHKRSESTGENGSRTTVHFLPPALNCIVRLWDEIVTDMFQVLAFSSHLTKYKLLTFQNQ